MPIFRHVKSWDRTFLYIIDSPKPDGPPDAPEDGSFEEKHAWNCRNIEGMVGQLTDWVIVRIHMKPGFKGKEFLQRMKDELMGKTEDDLLIFYYHGLAGDEEEDYSWNFENAPTKNIKAHKFIEMVADSAADSLFLLDCYMHTRLVSKWKRELGTTELLTAGGELQDTRGRRIERKGKTFTDGILHSLKGWIAYLKSPAGSKVSAMQTLPQILSDYKPMPFNPVRIDVRAKPGMGQLRFKLDPNSIRQTGKIEFFGVVTRTPGVVGETGDGSQVSGMEQCLPEDKEYGEAGEGEGSGAAGEKDGNDGEEGGLFVEK